MSAPFFVTRSEGWGYVPLGTVDARDLREAAELAVLLYARIDRLTGLPNGEGVGVWHLHQVPDRWIAQVKKAERDADREDVVDCVKLHWRRFFDKTEKHNH